MTSISSPLLDQRYRIMAGLCGQSGEHHFAARHVALNIPVRIISVSVGERPGAQRTEVAQRFLARAAAAAALRHPGIVRIRDCFRQGTTCILVLDWTPEATLAARLAEQGPLPVRDALALGLHLCDMLAAVAHQAPHLLPLGTLAPVALTLQPDGHCILTDLGMRNWPYDCQPPHSLDRLPYAAPEILAGSARDVRADLYSLAAVLYAALAGEPPAPLSLGRLPLAELAPNVPPSICDVIERALQLDPADRSPSPEAFGMALGAAIRLAWPDLVARAHRPRALTVPASPDAKHAPLHVSRYLRKGGRIAAPAGH